MKTPPGGAGGVVGLSRTGSGSSVALDVVVGVGWQQLPAVAGGPPGEVGRWGRIDPSVALDIRGPVDEPGVPRLVFGTGEPFPREPDSLVRHGPSSLPDIRVVTLDGRTVLHQTRPAEPSGDGRRVR